MAISKPLWKATIVWPAPRLSEVLEIYGWGQNDKVLTLLLDEQQPVGARRIINLDHVVDVFIAKIESGH